jgi:predicted metal-dependent phosphoesterase TrpH
VRTNHAATVREAFHRYLGDRGRAAVPKRRLPVADAIALVRGAGGATAWAHPTHDVSAETVAELRRLGLHALEASFPGATRGREDQLRRWAHQFRLAVTGGSDCHGPDPPHRAVGSCGVTYDELEQLRMLAS